MAVQVSEEDYSLTLYYYSKALRVFEIGLGKNNNDYLNAWANLAYGYIQNKEENKAEKIFAKMIQIYENSEEKYFDGILVGLIGLADIMYDKGNLSEAESLFKKQIRMTKIWGYPKIKMARICNTKGRFKEAESFYENGIKNIEETSKDDCSNLKEMKLELADIYKKNMKYKKANDIYKIELEREEKRLSMKNNCFEEGIRALADLYREMNRDEAEFLEKTADRLKKYREKEKKN